MSFTLFVHHGRCNPVQYDQPVNGFLKVSLEEILIALRDDRHLLKDPGGLLDGRWMETDWSGAASFDHSPSLYPDGFSASRFVEVIESEAVWEGFGEGPSIGNAGSEKYLMGLVDRREGKRIAFSPEP
jgi:hypothetical protein